MRKSAPGWGKAIGIIMICLGGLSVFYQLYKIVFPAIFRTIPRQIENISRMDPNFDRNGEQAINQFNSIIGMSESQANLLVTLGILGIISLIFYIVGGAKLLTVKPENYKFAKFALSGFILYNVIGGILFLSTNSGWFAGIIMMYSIIGLVFDITLLIILLSSNKAAYGIGTAPELETYTQDQNDEEIL